MRSKELINIKETIEKELKSNIIKNYRGCSLDIELIVDDVGEMSVTEFGNIFFEKIDSAISNDEYKEIVIKAVFNVCSLIKDTQSANGKTKSIKIGSFQKLKEREIRLKNDKKIKLIFGYIEIRPDDEDGC